MARKQVYEVKLSRSERDHLEHLVSTGVEKARKLTRARILLKSDEGWTDEQIAAALNISRPTVGRVRKRYAQEGLASALNRKPTRRQYERKIDGKTEAHLIALVCGAPPEGYARWSLRLLAERLVTLEQVGLEAVSHETVRQVLKKTNSSLGKTSNG
ncbi:MAG: helix-turn-helix domain-containing protein [Anaerolineae bacterium]